MNLSTRTPQSIGESFCIRYTQLHQHVEKIPERIKHKISQLNHLPNSDEHLFLVQQGLTLGEYNLLYFLHYFDKRKQYQQKSSSSGYLATTSNARPDT